LELDTLKKDYETYEAKPAFEPTEEQMESNHRNTMCAQQLLKEIFAIKDTQGLILFDARDGPM
jgi:hypothetical protein